MNMSAQTQNTTSNDHLKLALSTLTSLVDNNFECSICLDTFSDPHVIPECLHRFCGACVKESIRKCGAECPTCRARITTKRGLRKDNYLQEDMVSECDCDYLSVILLSVSSLLVIIALECLLLVPVLTLNVCFSATTDVDGVEDSYASESGKI